MPATELDLWPPNFAAFDDISPVSILRQQGEVLARKTNHVVVGEVRSARDVGESFVHQFVLSCTALGYRYPLLSVTHGLSPYPAQLDYLPEPPIRDAAGSPVRKRVAVASREDFVARLKEYFADGRTTEIIRSLVTQTRDIVGLEEAG